MPIKRVLPLLALILGVVGATACVGGGYVVWRLGARLQQANERTFVIVDAGLTAAGERVQAVRGRMRQARITTAEITENLRDSTSRIAQARAVSRVEIQARAEKLAEYLQTANTWLETSAESVRGVQRMIEVSALVGAPVNPAALDDVLQIVAALREKLLETQQAVDGVREFAARTDGESGEDRAKRITTLLTRIALTAVEVDALVVRCANRLSEAAGDARRVEAQVSRYILWATISCYMLLAWVAAGQIALCVYGWKFVAPRESLNCSSK